VIILTVLYTSTIYLRQLYIVDIYPTGSLRLVIYYLIFLPSNTSRVAILAPKALGISLYKILVGEYLR